MLDSWVFIIALVEMLVACILYLFVLKQQFSTFKNNSRLQPLRRLLFGTVLFLLIGALPLMYVYANIVWFHNDSLWIVYMAVISNATSKLIGATLIYMIYKFRIDNQ